MANEFLHRELTEKEKEAIKVQAKQIMDNFANKLGEVKETKKIKTEKKDFERKEGEKCDNKINRETMFQNAPKKNKDFIIAEKKQW